MHPHSPDRLCGRHLPRNHQVGQGTGSRSGHPDQAVHQHATATVDAVLDELGGYVKVPRDIRARLVQHREAHVPVRDRYKEDKLSNINVFSYDLILKDSDFRSVLRLDVLT